MANEIAHTPGPWFLETVRTSVGVCHKVGPLGHSTKFHNACLYDDCYSDKPHDLQLLADARLITAAPELLGALKGLLDDIEEYQKINNLGGEKNITQVLARAAIAKAEGGQ